MDVCIFKSTSSLSSFFLFIQSWISERDKKPLSISFQKNTHDPRCLSVCLSSSSVRPFVCPSDVQPESNKVRKKVCVHEWINEGDGEEGNLLTIILYYDRRRVSLIICGIDTSSGSTYSRDFMANHLNLANRIAVEPTIMRIAVSVYST